VDAQIAKWLSKGHVTDQVPDNSWNIPLLVAPKKDEAGNVVGQRVCLDPRMINEMMDPSALPMPVITELLDSLNGSKVFSKLDQESGFHQFALRPEDRKKTAFTWKNKRYMFQSAPFGFKNFPQDYSRVMLVVFEDMSFFLVYMDDLIVHSSSFKEHFGHLRKVISRLNQYNFKLGLKKCILGRPEIIMLGHLISEEGRRIVEEKLVVIEKWESPRTGKMLQSQLGFFNYFRDEIPLYSRLFAPLEQLRNAKTITWSPNYQKIYDVALAILRKKLLLCFPDFEKDFFVSTDASKYGIGGVLYQEDEGKRIRYVKFAAKSLNAAQINYPATKRELFAIMYCLKQFHYWIFGRQFTLITDHSALTYMMTVVNN
jgi:RNase H-like domain found in reverse transcriptase/Reverse transcriptase (RNA-dependent DNA polymerase)